MTVIKRSNFENASLTFQAKGLGIYIHWPFCQSLCPYCDFNSYVSNSIDIDSWAVAYKKAIKASASLTDFKGVNSIYFGGGTPSLMTPRLINEILNQIYKEFKIVGNIEITLEANPSSSDYSNFKAYSSSGVNRCSLGIQALNDKDLKALGRLHSANEALKALEISQACFTMSSFDLIYGRQKQSISAWEEELIYALSFNPQHLSLYQLTIEPGTPFFKLKENNKLPGLPSVEKECSFFATTKMLCKKANLTHYEISNFSLPGSESRHNLNYWRYGDFIGIGPGAFGRITIDGKKYETETYKKPDKWYKSVLKNPSHLYSMRKPISQKNQAKEYAIMSLRLKEGMNIQRFNNLSNFKLDDNAIQELETLGLAYRYENQLLKTQKGELLLNAILMHIFNSNSSSL